MKRVIVAGAGPAGSTAAMELGRVPGIECVMLDKKPLPRTKVCGSGLSPWTLSLLDEMGVGEQVRAKAFRIDGAVIAGSHGPGVALRGDHETAVLLRAEFDELLAREAQQRGAELREGVRLLSIERSGRRVVGVRTSEGDLEADAVVDATGAKGNLVPSERPGGTLHTIVGWYEGVQGTADVVELWFDASVKPHYGWIFPETATRVNIGIVFDPARGEGNARERFERFVGERIGARMEGAQQLGRLMGHPVHASAVPRDLVRDGVLVAGEAGRLVDFATAEGIFHALVSGRVAGQTFAEVLGRGRVPTREAMAGYEKRVQRHLAARMIGGRVLMEALRTPALDWMLRLSHTKASRTVLTKAFAGLYHG
jgi:menaquinone-9 beta-reductase